VSNLWHPGGLRAFDPAISRDSHANLPAKPDPASLLAIAEAWGVPLPSGELIMVGDSPSNDVAFGQAAGVATALVDSGRRYVEGGSDGGADIRVDCLLYLPRQLWQAFHIDGPLGTAAPLVKLTPPVPSSKASTAAALGDLAALEQLSALERNEADPASSNTPLIWAADSGQAECVSLLLATDGVDANARGFLGATACSRASRKGHAECLRVLLAGHSPAAVNSDIPNDKLQYPLHFAAFKQHPECVDVLLAAGTNPLVLDRKGRTPAQDTADESIAAVLAGAEKKWLRAATMTGVLDVK